MNEQEFKNYLDGRYDENIQKYNNRAKISYYAYTIFQWSLVILSALTPALILTEQVSKWIAVGVAVLVAISSAALKTFKYQENWIRYRSTWHALNREKFFYEAGVQGYEKEKNKEALFVQRVESIIEQEANEFVAEHKKQEQ